MCAQRRKFSHDEKLLIIAQAQQLGVGRVLAEYNLSYSVYARWKLQVKALRSATNSDVLQRRVLELEQENARLKEIITTLLLQKGNAPDPYHENG